jgi:hypothetical protein
MSKTAMIFMNDFEAKFRTALRIPPPSKKTSFSESSVLCSQPKGRFSDWDLKCWLDVVHLTPEQIKEIDQFIRSYIGFTHVGLFSKPSLQKNESGIQYMAYMPGESNAPFLDLHFRGPFMITNNDHIALLLAIFWGDDRDHRLWTALTCWRKVKIGDLDDARSKYDENNHNYWEETADDFVINPFSFFKSKFPGVEPPKILTN